MNIKNLKTQNTQNMVDHLVDQMDKDVDVFLVHDLLANYYHFNVYNFHHGKYHQYMDDHREDFEDFVSKTTVRNIEGYLLAHEMTEAL